MDGLCTSRELFSSPPSFQMHSQPKLKSFTSSSVPLRLLCLPVTRRCLPRHPGNRTHATPAIAARGTATPIERESDGDCAESTNVRASSGPSFLLLPHGLLFKDETIPPANHVRSHNSCTAANYHQTAPGASGRHDRQFGQCNGDVRQQQYVRHGRQFGGHSHRQWYRRQWCWQWQWQQWCWRSGSVASESEKRTGTGSSNYLSAGRHGGVEGVAGRREVREMG